MDNIKPSKLHDQERHPDSSPVDMNVESTPLEWLAFAFPKLLSFKHENHAQELSVLLDSLPSFHGF